MIKELIERLNNEAITQTTSFDEQVELDPYLEDWYVVDTNLLTDSRRWYETSVTVFKHIKSESFLGMRHITLMYTEGADYSDFCHFYKFYEMQPTQHITYTIID